MGVGAHREVGGISLTEVRYPVGFTMPRHSHEEAYFTIVLGGGYSEQMESASRTCREGTVVFRPAGEPHASQFHAGGSRCLRVRFSPAWLAGLPRDLRLPERSIDTRYRRATWLAVQLHAEYRAHDTAALAAIQGLTLALLADVARAPLPRERSTPPWLSRVLERIHAEYRSPLSLADLAATADVHPVHLARVFRQCQGDTVAAYLRRLRFEWSLRELRASERPLAEVARAAGFADQSHFSRAFRKATGLTPKAYRDRGWRR